MADEHLAKGEDHIRAQQARIDTLERLARHDGGAGFSRDVARGAEFAGGASRIYSVRELADDRLGQRG
jgi:hypothetical protein